MENIKPSEISEVLLKQLQGVDLTVKYEEVGQVLQVSDGVARLSGLSNVEAGELLEFDGGISGMALNLEHDFVGAVLLGSDKDIKEGNEIRELILSEKRIFEDKFRPDHGDLYKKMHKSLWSWLAEQRDNADEDDKPVWEKLVAKAKELY